LRVLVKSFLALAVHMLGWPERPAGRRPQKRGSSATSSRASSRGLSLGTSRIHRSKSGAETAPAANERVSCPDYSGAAPKTTLTPPLVWTISACCCGPRSPRQSPRTSLLGLPPHGGIVGRCAGQSSGCSRQVKLFGFQWTFGLAHTQPRRHMMDLPERVQRRPRRSVSSPATRWSMRHPGCWQVCHPTPS